MRRALADTLIELCGGDDRVVLLTADLGFKVFDEFRLRFPERYFNVGIAEQAMVDAAAGLASKGFKPIVYSIASFMTGRAYEQIRLSVGYNEFPVVVIGGGGGVTYSRSGPTHHTLDDFALMLSIPDLAVCAPHGPRELSQCLRLLVGSPGGAYVRIEKFGEPDLLSEELSTVGQVMQAYGSRDSMIQIITTGTALAPCMEVARTLNFSDGVGVVHLPFLRPLDQSALRRSMAACQEVLVVEEHFPIGGLYDVVLQTLSEWGWKGRIQRVGPPATTVTQIGGLSAVRSSLGMDAHGIAQALRGVMESLR